MRLTIIIIGDEILLGQVTDTNSGEIARRLGTLGWQVVETVVVGDDAGSISRAVSRAMDQSDLVITTGGLGPTKDDITKQVLMDYFGGEPVMDPEVTANIEEVFARRGLQLNTLTRMQAMVPSTCRVIQNRLGTAPIMWFERDGKVLVSMPGVPFETVGMLKAAVIDEIHRRFTPDTAMLHHTFIVTGITESDLAERLSAWEEALPDGVHLAYLPSPGYIRLRLDVTAADEQTAAGREEQASAQLTALLGALLIHDGDATPAEILLGMLRERSMTVSSAESCTGGNIAHAITSVAGSSDCYAGTVVSYSNDVKHRVLGVSQSDLDTHGAVSAPVVRAMADGVAALMGTDCSIATSGIAGPGGATPGKPVGTVWMAVRTPAGTVERLCRFPGDRSRVIDRATTAAILMLIEEIHKKY